MNMFRKNYDLLLGIFNPDGWLEISYPFYFLLVENLILKRQILCFLNSLIHYHRYVDDTMRIGRDDKGNIFILERSSSAGENVVE